MAIYRPVVPVRALKAARRGVTMLSSYEREAGVIP